MTVQIHNWKQEILGTTPDPSVSIPYVLLSEYAGRNLYSSIIQPGGSNTGHFHPDKREYYHITGGEGEIVTQPADQLGTGIQPARQKVGEGMTFELPPGLVHRLFNTSKKEPLTFLFECPPEHMAPVNPVRTVVKDFGEPAGP